MSKNNTGDNPISPIQKSVNELIDGLNREAVMSERVNDHATIPQPRLELQKKYHDLLKDEKTRDANFALLTESLKTALDKEEDPHKAALMAMFHLEAIKGDGLRMSYGNEGRLNKDPKKDRELKADLIFKSNIDLKLNDIVKKYFSTLQRFILHD